MMLRESIKCAAGTSQHGMIFSCISLVSSARTQNKQLHLIITTTPTTTHNKQQTATQISKHFHERREYVKIHGRGIRSSLVALTSSQTFSPAA